MADWHKIRVEYITTATSYRKLAQKYGVGQTEICKHSKAEGWLAERERFVSESTTKQIENALEQEVDRAARIRTVADKLLDKVEEIIDALDLETGAKVIRSLTAAVKDLKEIQGMKSKLDQQEQEARIAALRQKSMTGDGDDDETGVILLPPRIGEVAEDE